jgi:pimeloyl-ACP methyl ester carboxylesterase
VVLIGQSIGTQVATHAAARVPDHVGMLVLQGPTVDPAYRTLPRLLSGWVLDARHEPAWMASTQVPEWCRVGPGQLRRLLRACLQDQLETTVRGLSARLPVRVVLGEQDRLCNRGWASTLTEAPARTMPGGHSAAAARPRLFATLVSELSQVVA